MKYSKIRDVKSPARGTPQSAGIDFFVPNDFDGYRTLSPGDSILIPSGIKVSVPENHVFVAFNKSGVATKKNLQVGACVVDEDYQGEIHIHLTNVGHQSVTINPGEKIVQFVLLPVNYANPVEIAIEDLYTFTTERGTGGFGSTGN